MKITFVKKILADGSVCRKCADVEQKLLESGQMARIDEVLIADERDPQSRGMLLAEQHSVERAPFFLVERVGQSTLVYTVYLKFAKDILQSDTQEKDELKEIMENNSDLDFL